MALAKKLSVIVPGLNEQFMRATVEDVLNHSGPDTEVIAVCDGYWPEPPIPDHPRLQVIHFTHPIGQRAATNAGARLSTAKYIMKLDAHCSVDDGFDEKMIQDMQPDWTMIPQMYRLHAFDWRCTACGWGVYQGTKPNTCEECHSPEISMSMVWEPRWSVGPTVSWRFDRDMRFQYWTRHKDHPAFKEQAKTCLIETMSCIGCVFLMERERFFKLGGMDENHGSWGQYGSELACKAWLSGGKMVTSTKTWAAHMFRTGNFSKNGESTWPYEIHQKDIEIARSYSRDMWLNDKWPLAVRPLSWLVDHFAPVPDWNDKVEDAT
jgi:hypothetical protein